MSKLSYLFQEGFRNLWRHKLTAFTAIGSVFFALLIIGIFILIQQNSHQLIDSIRSKYKIEAFFEDHVTDENASIIIDQVKAVEGVESVEFVSKADALEIYQSQFNENLIEILGYNPLPNSALIYFDKKDNIEVDSLIFKLEKIANINEIVYEGTLIRRIEKFYKTTTKILGYIALGFLIITMIIISNTVKLSVYAKQELITNLKSIGATKLFVKTPFIIEGILESLIGAILAIIVLIIAVKSFNIYFSNLTTFNIEYNIFGLAWLLAIAFLIGLLGSYRGIRVLLK